MAWTSPIRSRSRACQEGWVTRVKSCGEGTASKNVVHVAAAHTSMREKSEVDGSVINDDWLCCATTHA